MKLFADRSYGKLKDITLCTFLCGILSHGIMVFSKLAWHDDLEHGLYLALEKPIAMGRWMRAFLGWLVAEAFGGSNLSLPLFHGTLSILFIALSAYVVCETFDINDRCDYRLLCGIMVSFPVVTGTLGYMFTAPYYFFALLLSVVAVYSASKRLDATGFLIASVCVCLCLGIYQSYFSVTVSLFVILMILGIAKDRYDSVVQIIKQGLYYLGACVVGLVVYYVAWKLCMKLLGLTASDYQGFSSIGESRLTAYLQGVLKAYKAFFMSYKSQNENMYPMVLAKLQWLVVALCLLYSGCIIVKKLRKSASQGVIVALLILLLPVCMGLIYVMCASSPDASVHSLMLYGQVMLYVFLLCASRLPQINWGKAASAARRVAAAVMLLLIVGNVYFDNSCYLKAEMTKDQVVSDLTVLVSRVKSTKDYRDDLPVCFVMTGEKDASKTSMRQFNDIRIMPFANIDPYHNKRNLRNCLKYWCGFAPKFVSQSKFKDTEEVQAMPDYPDDGSIRIIDDTVVIKW